MSHQDLVRFRRMCGQFRWVAIAVTVVVGALLLMVYVGSPLMNWLVHHRQPSAQMGSFAIAHLPNLAYLFGVWSIGQAMGEVSRGRLIQPALASTLRRVGIALALGGVSAVFLTPNLVRLAGLPYSNSYVRFDVSAMTLAVIGAALFLLGRVVDQASRVQAELDEMI